MILLFCCNPAVLRSSREAVRVSTHDTISVMIPVVPFSILTHDLYIFMVDGEDVSLLVSQYIDLCTVTARERLFT